MNPKISLIIPIYNMENYIEKCLDSAINQTFSKIEIILVDDGSTDNSLQICKRYQGQDSRIKLFSQKNKGQGFARNLAIKEAEGEFIFCLDADDWLELNALEKIYEKSLNDDADVVICGWKRIDEESREIVNTRQDIYLLKDFSKDTINKHVFSAKLNLMACACLIKKSIISDNYIVYPNIFHEDLYVMAKVYYFANKVSVENENLYNWLIRKESTTNSFGMQNAIGFGSIAYDWKIFLLKEKVFDKYTKEYVQGILTYLNLYIHRVHSFANENEKNELLEFLKDTLAGLHELKDYKKYLDKEEINKRKAIISFYEKNILDDSISANSVTELKNKNNQLQGQLTEIKKSKGFKLLNKYYAGKIKFSSIKNKIGNKFSKEKIKIKKIFAKRYDVVFLPHKDYQVWTMGLIAQELKQFGMTSCIMDLTDHYKDERSREAAKKFPDIPFKDLSFLLDTKIVASSLICMNDWDPKVNRPLLKKSQKNNIKTIGIIEGINDFYDKDTGRERDAYQTVEYLLMTGEHDRQFFHNKKEKATVVGIPRLKELMNEKVVFPKKPLAVINVNFSYGVLEDKRDMWISSAVEGSAKAGIDYIITKHPADTGDYSNYNVSTKNMYDTIREGSIIISRFGSIIIEALAMGKPAIYHNPHNEQVQKFQEPMNAYSLSNDSESLAKAIKFELELNLDYRERANEFLDYHSNINSDKDSAYLAAESISKVLKGEI